MPKCLHLKVHREEQYGGSVINGKCGKKISLGLLKVCTHPASSLGWTTEPRDDCRWKVKCHGENMFSKKAELKKIFFKAFILIFGVNW